MREANKNASKSRSRNRYRQEIRKIAVPSATALRIILLTLAISLVASFELAKWNPHVLKIRGGPSLSEAYTALWQVQAGIAAVALPILLFVIELSKDREHIALQTHAVLIRETWIFFIIVFAIAGTVRIGCDIAWFCTEAVFVTDLIFVLFLTLGLTVFAYFRAATMLFSPATLKAKAMKVAKEKMQDSLDSSIELRLASRKLLLKLEELGIAGFFRPYGYPSDRYAALKASEIGTVTDINLDGLEEFVKKLPWKQPQHPFRLSELDLGLQNQPAEKPPKENRVWLVVQYQESLTAERPELLCLQKDAFVEAFLSPEALEAQLKEIITIRSSDDD
jgi:hypothetical protein